ncbi:hypothetical protein [Bacillus cereus]
MKKIICIISASISLLVGCDATKNELELIGDFASYIDAQNKDVEDDKGNLITKESLQFIEKNLDLFKTHDEEKSNRLVDPKIDYRHLSKDINQYSGTMYKDFGTIIEIQEVKDGNLDQTFTVIHLMNPETNQNYDILYMGKSDLLENDNVSFSGLPLMDTRFKNTSGGTTKLFMILASHLKKNES